MLDTLLNWILRAAFLLFGVGAVVALGRWVRYAWGERRERWAVRIGIGMLLLAGVYAAGHARMLLDAKEIEAGRQAYARYGDPRMAEINRAEVRGWILDCSGRDRDALARYGVRDGEVVRVYPLGQAGANLIGGGEDAEERDYTVERLFTDHLREPRSLGEAGELHPAGTDLRLTLCSGLTRRAWQLLQDADRPGAVIVQEVGTGAVLAYAATGGPHEAPLGIKQYAPPGSVFKLALSALWLEKGMPQTEIPCPSSIQVNARGQSIANYGGESYPPVSAPHGMLVVSCNTAAVEMARRLRERIGAEEFVDAYRRFGFHPYAKEPPAGVDRDFWRTDSDEWAERMSPPPSRIRISARTSPAEWAQMAIGQGPVDVTPIAISRFVQAIGNGGVMLPPFLEWSERRGRPEGTRVMSQRTAEQLQAAMRDVVREGTARGVAPQLRGLPYSLGGKTGTAQVRGAHDDGWFAGLVFGPEGKPLYTVTVYLRGGGPGGSRPAGVAAGITRYLAAEAAPAERERKEAE